MKSSVPNIKPTIQFRIKDIWQEVINRGRSSDKGIQKKKSVCRRRLLWLREINLGKYLELMFWKKRCDYVFKDLECRAKEDWDIVTIDVVIN